MPIAATTICALADNQLVILGWVSWSLEAGLTFLQTFMNQHLAQVFARVTSNEAKGLSKLLGPFCLWVKTILFLENRHIGDIA
jgi:hypothetical protein